MIRVVGLVDACMFIRVCVFVCVTQIDCHNYIRVLLVHRDQVFVCGTNAFAPQCSWRKVCFLFFLLLNHSFTKKDNVLRHAFFTIFQFELRPIDRLCLDLGSETAQKCVKQLCVRWCVRFCVIFAGDFYFVVRESRNFHRQFSTCADHASLIWIIWM